jgi:predicted Zn-dependent protease
MLKLLLQLLAMIALFFLTWFGLSRLDWMNIFNVEKAGIKTEEKLGNLYWEIISKLEKEYTDPSLINRVDSILIRICDANDIDRNEIKLHLVRKDEINAFALPDHHLVLYSGLINDCENAEELCGVLGHEIAHMEKGHIMRKLTREIGLSILISMTTGNGNPEIIQKAIKTLSSSAYDRNLEREADITGTEYLIHAKINPEPFATFLFRLTSMEEGLPEQMFWISSHPGSEERATDILEYIKTKNFDITPVMDSLQWLELKAALNTAF